MRRSFACLAAVLAAALAAKAGVTPGAVDIGLLKKTLVAHGQVVPSESRF